MDRERLVCRLTGYVKMYGHRTYVYLINVKTIFIFCCVVGILLARAAISGWTRILQIVDYWRSLVSGASSLLFSSLFFGILKFHINKFGFKNKMHAFEQNISHFLPFSSFLFTYPISRKIVLPFM